MLEQRYVPCLSFSNLFHSSYRSSLRSLTRLEKYTLLLTSHLPARPSIQPRSRIDCRRRRPVPWVSAVLVGTQTRTSDCRIEQLEISKMSNKISAVIRLSAGIGAWNFPARFDGGGWRSWRGPGLGG